MTISPATDSTLARRLRPIAGRPPGTLVVHEIYRSLQGESTFAGLPCVFVRLTGCHLRCSYCDSAHAFGSGEVRDVGEVAAHVLGLGGDLVEITGGEPLLQDEALDLIATLADAGRTVLVETSGAVPIEGVDPRARIILDLKTPGSGEVAANLWSNLDHLKPTDEVKFVLADQVDFDWAVEVVREHRLQERCPVLFAPVHGRLDAVELADWILGCDLAVRLQVQLHKILWGPTARGV